MTHLFWRARRQQGISLVELMVAITLSLILGTALIQIFSSSRSANRVQDATARLQENGRYIVDAMAQDIRMAGYMGCASIDKVPVFIQASSPPADVIFDSSNIINGLNNVAAGNTYNAVPGTDVVVIRRASDTGVKLDGNMTADNANISLVDNSPGFVSGDFLFISDCASADLFCANNVSTGSITIAHSSSCNITPKLSKAYGADAEVMAFRSTAYFIRDTGRTTTAGRPIRALMVQSRNAGQAAAALSAYELVEGVEDLQLEYGLDTTADGAPDEYRTANNLTAAQWADVSTVRLNLLLQSIDEGLVGTSGEMVQNLQFNGAAVAQDGRLRQVFSTTIAIRNRLP
jgi:type IV pilus assembly protein PilW